MANKFKHWDEASQSWVIDGASNASNLELTNQYFVDENGKSVSIDQAFTKVGNKLTKLEGNLAWVYNNGAKGGGGGEGGEGVSYTIDIAEGTTVYTSTGSITLNVMVNSGTVVKAFTIIAKNVDTGNVIGTWKKYSLSRTALDITGLDGTVNLEISAYDASLNYAIPKYVTVISGAISLSIQKTPAKTILRGVSAEVPATFTVTNNILGSSAAFTLSVNTIQVVNETNIITSPRTLSYNIRDIIFNNDLFTNIYTGQKFNFSAKATTILNGVTITSNIINFTVSVAEANTLIIVTDTVTEFIPSANVGETYADLSTYSQGSQLSFGYYLSYAPTTYSVFNVNYNVYLMSGITKVSETPLVTGLIPNINKGENNIFVLSTVNLDVNTNNQYLMIELKGSASSDAGDITAQYTKSVYCKISEATKIDLRANNDISTLLAYYSRVSGFPNNTTGTWKYMPNSTAFPYTDTLLSSFQDGINLTLKGVNGSTSGFIANTDSINSIPGIVLTGESYGYVEVADHMFPNYEIGTVDSFFQSKGFNISVTYKADKSSNPNEVIMGIGKYADGLLSTGFEITLEEVLVKIGSADTISCKLPQNELLTIDIDVSLLGEKAWYFKIYINGVLSAVSRVLEEYIDWTFGSNLYLGCRNDAGIRSNFSNVTIYDLKLYTSSQTEFAIVQNYMSATEQANLKLGVVDASLDSELRTKNLFDSAGDCLIWNKATRSFYDGEALYTKLVAQMDINTPYPLVLIEETSTSSTNFEAYSTAVFSASDKEAVMGANFPCKITFKNTIGTATITTPVGVSAEKGVRIGIQGTSSLSYNSKNYEIYIGDLDATGKKQLFTPEQPNYNWLPENEFTLKADVMDSAHVNNVVIGKIINGAVTNSLGTQIKPLSATPPMVVADTAFVDTASAVDIKSKMKHTSEGFPCLVFIKFAPDAITGVRDYKFCGIYNFNLGRYALHNLGLTLLTSYNKVNTTGPTLVTDYTETSTYWNTDDNNGVFSMEVNQNSSSQGAFQQDDDKIIKFMTDAVYSSQDTTKAYTKLKGFYTQMSNMALSPTQKYTMDDAGQTPTKLLDGVYDFNSAYYNFSATDTHMNWNNACAYFVIALVCGMVDSMCKNMTLRSWGSLSWYLAFYDMDTAFGLNNAGQDIVEYWAHLHRWYNIQAVDTGITDFTLEKNYVSSAEVKQYFASWWNRIWEVLENLPLRDSGAVTSDRTTVGKMYVNLRENLFPDPDEFIDKYYKSYTEETGSIMFNYDYKIKYLKVAQTYDQVTGYTDSTDFSQLKFLHGNRVMHVRDWFRKRIMFLDGVYGVTKDTINLSNSIESPITKSWLNNKATGSNVATKFNIQIAGSSKLLYRWTYDKTYGNFWINENAENAIVPIPAGETIVTMYANKYITKFDNFKNYPWTSLPSIDFPLLEYLDLSGLVNIPYNTFFAGGVYDKANDIGLKNIKTLILSRVKVTGSSSYTLDVSNCSKLQDLDISNSNITTVTLPISAVLKTYNLSGTSITKLNLSNQSFLTSLLIDNCNNLTEIILDNCSSLTTLSVPSNVRLITIKNCDALENLTINYSSINNSISPLSNIIIDNCAGLKNVNISGQNNPNLSVNLIGAMNLEDLNVSDTKSTNIVLPSLFIKNIPNFTSLKSINISRTDISNFIYNDNSRDINGTLIALDYLNLKEFVNLDNIVATGCKKLTKVVCSNNEINPINLSSGAFFGCTSLQRVIGHFNITGAEVFKGCSLLALNDQSIYSSYTPNQFLPGSIVTNISFDSSTTNLLSTFEGCSTFTFDDFKRLIIRIGSTVTSIEGMFKGCSNINNAIERTIFSTCRNLTVIKEAFSGTRLTGTFYSRTSNYSPADESTWGILDYLPKLVDAEAAFDSTSLEWIDNNVFAPIIYNGEITYSPLVKVDHMFRNCVRLSSCEDTRVDTPIEGLLNSETFFTNLRNLINVYPDGVFAGCLKVRMVVTNDIDGNTLLFHTINKVVTPMILTSSLYSGVKLVGEIKNNVFGGISKTIYDGVVPKYYIPTFTSIQYPFNSSYGELTVNLSQMGSIFRVIGTTLLQAIGVFYGTTCIGSKVIPPDIFKGCTVLNSIESLFSGLNLDNDGEVYIFPPTYDDSGITRGMFDDCRSLKTTRNLFNGCNNLKIQLIGEGFKNCQLKDVSGMFSNSGLFGIVPYRLFFMNKTNLDGSKSIVKTIANMSKLFSGCWCLGYDKNRKIDLKKVLIPETETSSAVYAPWQAHIVETEGSPVSYKLNVQNIVKTYNYDRDDNLTIPNPNYVVGGTEPETISNPEYNPGEFAFDIWYLDGYGWDGASSIEDQSGLDEQKSRLSKYFSYDAQQAVAISNNLSTEWYIESNQNYMIPTDLFRYCSNECTLSEVLSGLTWIENKVTINDATLEGTVGPGTKIEGLRGRIPVKLFQSLVTSSKFDGVFKNTYFDAFTGLQGMNTNNLIRGIMYPPDLLKYNSALTDIPNLFYGTTIPVGVDINTDLFFKLPSLKVINNLWSNCKFDSRSYNSSEIFSGIYSQFSFIDLFKYNTKITNASGLFAVINTGLGKGLLIIESALLEAAQNISNISNMFFYCTSLKGAVPLFYSGTYTALSNVSGYLIGVPENNITNRSDVETRLRPSDWSQI